MQLPDAFVWSKIGPEGGLDLHAILKWKELQRQLGMGLFYWGIGQTVKADKIAKVVNRDATATVLFSKQPSDFDARPSEVCFWTHFIDETGVARPLPKSACVTSSALTKSGQRKTKHYAFVCFRDQPLRLESGIPFDVGAYRNLGGKEIGDSQVSAVIERKQQPRHVRSYNNGFLATLRYPYVVTLVKPKKLTQAQLERQRQLMASDKISRRIFEDFLGQI